MTEPSNIRQYRAEAQRLYRNLPVIERDLDEITYVRKYIEKRLEQEKREPIKRKIRRWFQI